MEGFKQDNERARHMFQRWLRFQCGGKVGGTGLEAGRARRKLSLNPGRRVANRGQRGQGVEKSGRGDRILLELGQGRI